MNPKRSTSPNPDTTRKLAKTTPATPVSSIEINPKTPELPALPTEIWTSIFEQFSSNQLLTIRQVCHRWRTIISGCPPLLAKLTVTFPARLTICSGYQPDNLPLAAKAHFKNVTINAIGPWWPPFGAGLTELKLSCYSDVDHATLLEMISYTPNLKTFEFSESKLSGERASEDEDFRLDKLEKLVLRGIEDAAMVAVFRGRCCALKSLRITWDWFTEGHIVSAQEMAAFLGGFQHSLEELYITCSEDTLVEVKKLDRLKLRKLTLVGDDKDDDLANNLTELFRMQSSLEYLKIKEILTLEESKHSLLCNIGPILTNLNFLQITGTHVDLAFLYNFPKLQTLKLSGGWYDSVTIQFNGDAHSNLRELQLKEIHFQDSCLQQHLPKMPNLHSITIIWSTFNYWPDLLDALKSLKQLQRLSLNGVNVNESADCTLDGFVTPLTHLLLAHCEMSPRLLAAVLSGCPDLRELRLQSMELNDNLDHETESTAVHVVCRKLPKLNSLIIEKCKLSAEGVDFIRENCKSLKELQIMGSW